MATIFEKIMRQAVLTDTIVGPVQTELEAAARLGDQIAPLVNVNTEHIAQGDAGIASFGIGQVAAPEATPPLVDLTGAEEEQRYISLLRYDEMHRISPTRWERLQSTDDNVAREEFLDLIDIGQRLEQRNERLTEVHRWQAFAGQVTYTYQNGDSPLIVNYDLPTGHRPTVSIAWTDLVNSDPIADLKAWRLKVADNAGNPGVIYHISSEDLDLVLKNQKLKAYFNIPSGQPFIPTENDVARLVGAGTRFVIADQGYREEAVGTAKDKAVHTRYKPLGKVLVTTEYNNNGRPIATTPNGKVEIQTGYNTGVLLHGPQSEVKMHDMSMQRFLRQASKRIPRLVQPGAFLYGTVR